MNDLDDLLAADPSVDPDDLGEREWTLVSGAEFHALTSGSTIRTGQGPAGFDGHVTTRGEVYVVTDEMIRANEDRFGSSWMDIIADGDAQIMKWGEPRFAPGRPSPRMRPWTPGSVEEADAREEARLRAHAIEDAQKRAEELRAVDAAFGPRRPTSRTLAEYDEDGKVVRRAR